MHRYICITVGNNREYITHYFNHSFIQYIYTLQTYIKFKVLFLDRAVTWSAIAAAQM